MLDKKEIIDQFRVEPGKKVRLKDYDPGWMGGDGDMPKAERKELAAKILTEDVSALAEAQEKLYADDTWSLLVILQAMDAAGKDSTIKHVMSGINPQGCQVFSFKHPSLEELDHDFLWRCARCLPERGRIGIFNRSYYEEVLIARVHRQIIAAQHLPNADPDDKKFWEHRYESINNFERHLVRNGTAIAKFFLYVSKDEQRKRFLDRINNPAKHWKLSLLVVRASSFDFPSTFGFSHSSLSRDRIVFSRRASGLDQRRFHVFQRNVPQLDLLRTEAVKHGADQVVFRNGPAGPLANRF